MFSGKYHEQLTTWLSLSQRQTSSQASLCSLQPPLTSCSSSWPELQLSRSSIHSTVLVTSLPSTRTSLATTSIKRNHRNDMSHVNTSPVWADVLQWGEGFLKWELASSLHSRVRRPGLAIFCHVSDTAQYPQSAITLSAPSTVGRAGRHSGVKLWMKKAGWQCEGIKSWHWQVKSRGPKTQPCKNNNNQWIHFGSLLYGVIDYFIKFKIMSWNQQAET